MAEMAVLKEDLATFPHMFDIALGIGIPGVVFRTVNIFHEPPHRLVHNMGIGISRIVFPFRINAVGLLGRLQDEGLAMYFGGGRGCRMDRPQFDRLIKAWQQRTISKPA